MMRGEPQARERRRGAAGARRAALLVAVSVALIALPVAPAWAHNHVVATTPAKGAVVTEQPGTISLETSGELLDVGDGSAIRVQGPDGLYFGDGCTDISGVTASTQAQLGTPGAYTVTWQVVSTDGHPISGTWTFDWQPAEGVELAEGTAEPGVCGGEAVVSTPGGTSDEAAGDETDEATDAAPTSALLDALWIGGGVLLAAIAALGTWLVVRRRGQDQG